MRTPLCMLLVLGGCLALLTASAFAATLPVRQVSVSIPHTNMPVDFQASDHSLLYTQSDPLIGTLPKCVSCGDPPFTDFHIQFYLADVHSTSGALTTLTPRLLFTEGQGINIAPYSIGGGWVIYLRYHSYDVEDGTYWNLVARNVKSGGQILLDSPQLEGLPSVPSGARSDGHTVVWASWTHGPAGPTSVIRTYDLSTGSRTAAIYGGSLNTWGYTHPVISGALIAFERDSYGKSPGDYTHQSSRILIIDRLTHRIRTLTPGHTFQSQPSISGRVVVWKDGANGGQGKGIVVENLRTGARKSLPGFDAEGPRAVGGRYAVFPFGNRTNEAAGYTIEVYDTVTGAIQTLFQHHGVWGTGNGIRAGQHTVVYQTGTPTDRNGHSSSRLTVAHLP